MSRLGEITGTIGAGLSIVGFVPTLVQSFREPDKPVNIWTLLIFIVSDIVWMINGAADGDNQLFWSMLIQGTIVAIVFVRTLMLSGRTKKA